MIAYTPALWLAAVVRDCVVVSSPGDVCCATRSLPTTCVQLADKPARRPNHSHQQKDILLNKADNFAELPQEETYPLQQSNELLVSLCSQVLQDKVTGISHKASELEAQLSAERERAAGEEERGRTLARQLAEQQQESANLAKKREDSEAELASQVNWSVD